MVAKTALPSVTPVPMTEAGGVKPAPSVWGIFRKLMSPLEYLLFGMNMVFLFEYTWREACEAERFSHFPSSPQLNPRAREDRWLALEMMALIDQLLLFFFALKVCLTFSQNVTSEIYADEIKAELKEEEARMIAASLQNSSEKKPSGPRANKYSKKYFKHPAQNAQPSSAASLASPGAINYLLEQF